MLFQQLYNIADSLVAGKFISADALAAVGNSYEITLIFIAFAFGCNMGASVLVSQYYGAGRLKEMRSAITTSAITVGVLALVLTVLGMFFTGYRFTADAALPVRSEAFISADSHVLNGITQASRVFAYAGIGYLFALTTDKIHMIRSFQRQLHLPQVFAYGLLAAWGAFPHMAMEYRKTRAAFRARGIRLFPASPALLAPLLVKSVRWSNELSSAMESKGFSPDAKRSEYSPVKVHLYDWIFLIFCCALIPVLSMIA